MMNTSSNSTRNVEKISRKGKKRLLILSTWELANTPGEEFISKTMDIK